MYGTERAHPARVGARSEACDQGNNGLTLIAVVTLDVLFLSYAYISFFCLLAGIGTIHLIYIILRNKCGRECPVLFA